MAGVPNPMEIGDHIHNFKLPSTTGAALAPSDFVGKSLVIFFFRLEGENGSQPEASGFRDLSAEFEKLGVVILGIGTDSEASQKAFAVANDLSFPLLCDSTGRTCKQYGAMQEEMVNGQASVSVMRQIYFVTPDFRVAKAYTSDEPGNVASRVLEDAKAILLREEPRRMIAHAPIILIPNVLSPAMCKTLMDLWETQNEESGFMKQVEGKTVGMVDYNHKIRRDHFIKPGELQTRLQGYMGQRVVPEIRKAFNYSVTRREDFRIACYDASKGGYFRPHRDNTTDATAHRRLAMSLLLNDEYEGGFLRFPEYGRHTYRPEAGGAVIFSCSLLHEATDVTAGRRFVLLSFFYGEAEAKAREEYNKRVGGNYKA